MANPKEIPEAVSLSARNRSETGNLHFSVDARLLFELGEQLVARKSVALAELVKNAYDADATKVTVRLNGVTHTIAGNRLDYSP